MQKRKWKRGKRGDAADEAACIRASRSLYAAEIVDAVFLAREAAAAPVCLLPAASASASDGVLALVANRLRIREAKLGAGVSALLPASGTAIVLFHPLLTTRWADVDKADQEIMQMLSRRQDYTDACQRVGTVSKANTNVLVVVLDDLELYKFLSLECAGCANVAILPCHGAGEAADQICARGEAHALYKSSVQQHVRSEHATKCIVPTMAAQPMQQLVWDALGVKDTSLMRDGDLFDLLSGRLNAHMCQERFGWSAHTSNATLRALQSNDAIEH